MDSSLPASSGAVGPVRVPPARVVASHIAALVHTHTCRRLQRRRGGPLYSKIVAYEVGMRNFVGVFEFCLRASLGKKMGTQFQAAGDDDADWDDIGWEEVAAAYVLLLFCIMYLWRYVFRDNAKGESAAAAAADENIDTSNIQATAPENEAEVSVGEMQEWDDEPWDRIVRPRLDVRADTGLLPSQSSWHDHRFQLHHDDPTAFFAAAATEPPRAQAQMQPHNFSAESVGDELGGTSVFILPMSTSLLPPPLHPPLVSQTPSRARQQLAVQVHAASAADSTYLARKLEAAQHRATARQRLRAHAPTQLDSLCRDT